MSDIGRPFVSLDVRYALGHSYPETWEWTTFHCPNCGRQEVWREHGEGDYYQGPSHLCIACPYEFTLPSHRHAEDGQGETIWAQRLLAIRAGAPQEHP